MVSILVLITVALEDLVEIKLIPPDPWPQACKLPDLAASIIHVKLAVPVFDSGVTMALVLHSLLIWSRVALVGRSELMVADDELVIDLFPFGSAKKMLSVHQGIANKADMGHDTQEIGRLHRRPMVAIDFAVVNLQPSGLLDVGSLDR